MKKTDFFTNVGGINLTDSTFYIKDDQAAGGWNFDYTRTGAVVKSRDVTAVNAVADAQNACYGLGLLNTRAGVKTTLRAAGTKMQTVDLNANIFTNLASDTVAASTDFFTSGSTQPVVFENFNTVNADICWFTGANSSYLYGVTGSNVTVNGSAPPSGVMLVTSLGSSTGGNFTTTGTYFYSLALRKRSTQALSNAALDASVTLAATTETIQITFPTGVDSTLYDQWYIYRSSVAGVTNFTTGTLVAQVATTSATYIDPGNINVATAQPVPRAGNTTDNSILPKYISGVYTLTASSNLITGNVVTTIVNGRTYTTNFATNNAATLQAVVAAISVDRDIFSVSTDSLSKITITGRINTVLTLSATVTGGSSQATFSVANTTLPSTITGYSTLGAFKRRLVTAQGSTFYLSDLDKPESWPIANSFTIPTGGNITAIATIGYNGPISSTIDEYLVLFKETETWVFTGSTSADWQLKFVDQVGCASQPLVVSVSGFITWVDYRGIWVWSGTGKPVYTSRPIEALFAYDGDLDKPKLFRGIGQYFRKQNQVVWILSHRTRGTNKYLLKMDLRLTANRFSQDMDKVVIEGVFTQGYSNISYYAACSFLDSTKNENFLVADNAGFLYKHFTGVTAAGSAIDFQYETRHLDMGMSSIAKRFKKVVVWVDELVSANLTLDYWAEYRVQDLEASTISETMLVKDDPRQAHASIWDFAVWDISEWDDYLPKVKGVVFNLSAGENNVDGDSLKLRIKQQSASVPVVMHGFTVFWDDLSVRK